MKRMIEKFFKMQAGSWFVAYENRMEEMIMQPGAAQRKDGRYAESVFYEFADGDNSSSRDSRRVSGKMGDLPGTEEVFLCFMGGGRDASGFPVFSVLCF